MPQMRTQSHAGPSRARTSARSPDAAALEIFVGEWHAEGEQLGGPVGPAARIHAAERYEWLQGHAFLIHRFDGHVGASPASCIELIGCDRESGRCRIHTFYNNGLTNVWDVELDGQRWLLCGDWNMGGKSMKVRSTITFGEGGRSYHNRWECSDDGRRWQTFWDLRASKALPH